MQVSFCTLSGGLFLALGKDKFYLYCGWLRCLIPLYLIFTPDLAWHMRCQHVRLAAFQLAWPKSPSKLLFHVCQMLCHACFAAKVAPTTPKVTKLCATKSKNGNKMQLKTWR